LTTTLLYADKDRPNPTKRFVDRLIVKYSDQVFTQREIEQTFQVATALVQNNLISEHSIAEKAPDSWRNLVELHSFFLTGLNVAKTSTGYRPDKTSVEQATKKLKPQFPHLRSLKKLVRQWLWVNQMASARQREGQLHFHSSRWFKRAHSKVRTLYYSGAFEKRR
jgi:hypothetical protein